MIKNNNYLTNEEKDKIIELYNKGTVSFITFGRFQDIFNFYNYIYYSGDVVCLERKKTKFDEYILNAN